MELEIKKDFEGFKTQINVFCVKIDTYSGLLALSPAKVANIKKVKELVNFVFEANVAIHGYSGDIAQYAMKLFRGHNDEPLGAIPLPTSYPAILPDVTEPNATAQLADLLQDCKRSPDFTSNIAAELGVLKSSTPFDPEAGKPIIKLKTAEGGHPLLHVKKGQYEGWELWKDRSDGKGFVKAEKVLRPDYLDPDPLPAIGTSAVWRYKAIYLYADKHAGSWSDDATITVLGSV